jgi:hypothetical protein
MIVPGIWVRKELADVRGEDAACRGERGVGQMSGTELRKLSEILSEEKNI